MVDLPAAGYFSDAARTNSEAKTAQDDMLSVIRGTIGEDSTIFPNKNAIINGNFNVWQRGTSFTAPSTNDYGPDRWKSRFSLGTGVFDILQETATLPDGTVDIAYSLDVTTAEAAIAAAEYCIIEQPIEGYNAVQFALGTSDAKEMILSFWVYSTITGTYCASFRNSAENRSYVAEYTVSVTNTWEKKTVTLTGDTGGGWLTTNGIGLYVSFALAAGTNFHGTADTWEGAQDFATSNQVNALDSASNFFRLSQVQLELGSAATPFEHTDYGVELARCKRYFEVLNTNGSTTYRFQNGMMVTASVFRGVLLFTQKRASPSIANGSSTASHWALANPNGTLAAVTTLPSYSTLDAQSSQSQVISTNLSGVTAGFASMLVAQHATATINIDAEL